MFLIESSQDFCSFKRFLILGGSGTRFLTKWFLALHLKSLLIVGKAKCFEKYFHSAFIDFNLTPW